MIQRDYPRTVVLRKSIVTIVVIWTLLILILILHNLYRSSYKWTAIQSDNKSTVQATASEADTSWYKNLEIKKLPPEQIMPDSTHSHNPAVVTATAQSAMKQDDVITQQSQQDLIKAMSAPITSNQLVGEKQTVSSNSSMSDSSSQNNGVMSGSDQNLQGEKKAFLQSEAQSHDGDYLGSALKNPVSPYEVQAGTIIPGVLITGINSDLPGKIKGQVRSNVYDSISGKFLLIPQGATLVGVYDSQVTYGQRRVLIAWSRIIFPNGQSINLQGMPGVDMSGYAGFHDQVDNHYTKIFGSVVFMSVLGAAAQLSQPQSSSNPWQAPTVSQTLAQSLGTNLANTGTMLTAKNINIQPTLEIRQGYQFNISVTKDIVFPGSYNG